MRQIYNESQGQFIRSIEHDGRQLVVYKILEDTYKMNENEVASLYIISEHKWINHQKALWRNDDMKVDHSNGNIRYLRERPNNVGVT